MTSVVNIKRGEPYDVYVGRPSPFGNPFRLGKGRSRAEVLEQYRAWLATQPELIARIRRELRGKRLGCYCSPLECHGHVLARVAEGGEP